MPSTGGDLVYDSNVGGWVVKAGNSVIWVAGKNGAGWFGKVVAQQSHIADATASHAEATTFANVATDVNALGVKINSILTVLENYGLVKTS